MNNQEANVFHTVSHAEYHEPFLRRVLAKYAASVEGRPEAADDILTDDRAFHRAAHNYKQVVTHFFTCKLETWIISFLRPTLGLQHISGSIEFGTTRGAIHAHLLGILESTAREWIDKLLATYATSISDALTDLDDGIRAMYVEQEGCQDPLDRSGKTPAETMQARVDWCNAAPDRKHLIETYNKAFEDAGRTASVAIGDVLEREFGMTAFHPGQSPEEWLRPGGKASMGYRSSFEGMLSRQHVLDTQELRKFKFDREMDLYPRLVNVVNNAFCHACSNYCWKETKLSVLFDPSVHSANDPTKYTRASNGLQYIVKSTWECRFGFGRKQLFDPSGESNLTEGMPPLFDPVIEFDRNKMPIYRAPRNHPRVLQQPTSVYYYIVLSNNKTYNVVVNERQEDYATFANNQMDAGTTGLEQFSGSDAMTNYACSYECKGHASSESWSQTLLQISNEYVSDGRGSQNLRCVVAKFMNEISKARSVPKDEACYCLAGGLLTYNDMPVKKCAVNNIELDDILPADSEVDSSDKKFTWVRILRAYNVRPDDLDHINLYIFASCKYLKGPPVVPQFFGFKNAATWPLNEEYAMWMMRLFCPFRGSMDSLKVDGTYARALELYMWDPRFPKKYAVEIEHRKR